MDRARLRTLAQAAEGPMTVDWAYLRECAEAANTGSWTLNHNEDGAWCVDEQRGGPDGVWYIHVADVLSLAHAKHIALFDPPTALTLLARLDEAEGLLWEVLDSEPMPDTPEPYDVYEDNRRGAEWSYRKQAARTAARAFLAPSTPTDADA